MPFKYDPTGNIVVADHAGKKLPVFINAKGEEAPFDADGTVTTIATLNGEARTHRTRAEAAEAKLAIYADITDPVKAKEALGIVANLDAKKLVDAGEVERVRTEIGRAWEGKLTEANGKLQDLTAQYYAEKIGGAFARSKFIAERVDPRYPIDMLQARFESHFGLEDGEIVAVDANGNKLYSNINPGKLAGFDEAFGMILGTHPQKDSILKGTGASGGGAQNNGGPGSQSQGGKQTITRSQFDKMPPAEKATAARTASIVDG